MNNFYGIFKYEINNLCSYISYQSNTPLHHTKQKPQLTYIDNYLSFFDKGKIFFICENEYIEQHYLEDYSEYYSRCFESYKKDCSRIHFFQNKKTNDLPLDAELEKALSGKESIINNENYIGYIVIRPIPQTFLAKVCFKPYFEEDRLGKYIITKSNDASLFGIKLNIKSVAYQEQDRVLSACATSSLWSFFYAHPDMSILHLPSPSSITKKAYPEYNGHDREFPNSGLSTEMICRSLRSNGLSPKYFEFFKESRTDKELNLHLFKEHIFSYCSSGLPLLLGISVKNTDSELKGFHAVTIVGYSLEPYENNIDDKINIISHRLNKIYIQDDRYGAFVKIKFNDDHELDVSLDKNNSVTNIENFNSELYTPDTLIIATYHKVRISYVTIKETCQSLSEILTSWLSFQNNTENHIYVLKSFCWDFQIKEVSTLKNWILNSDIKDKEKYLTASWPKYIWSAKVYIDKVEIFELLFDATGIDQGHLFLDILPIEHDSALAFISLLQTYCNKKYNFRTKKDNFTRNPDNNIWGIIKHFRKKPTYLDNLDYLFGKVNFPRIIKKEEVTNDTVVDQCDVRLGYHDHSYTLNKDLAKDLKYIWVIDIDGFLCIGKEQEGSLRGHPTLTDGMPARIGGELTYDLNLNRWDINPFSGRYSSDYSIEEKETFLNKALKQKFNIYFPDEEFNLFLITSYV